MKVNFTPMATPLCLTNSLNTPSSQGADHYFAAYHNRAAALDDVFRETQIEDVSLSGDVDSPKVPLMDLLPNEILSLILEFSYFGFNGECAPNFAFRTLASQISRRFQQLVLHTPSLWSTIQLSQDNVSDEIVELLLGESTTDELMDKLVPHIKRWRRFSITTANAYILSFLRHNPAPVLEYLNISFYSHRHRTSLPPSIFTGHLPRLSYLCLRNVNIDNLDFSLRELKTLEIRGYGVWPTYSRLNEMLGGSSRLEHFILHVKSSHVWQEIFPHQPDPNEDRPIVLPELRTLEVYTSEWLTINLTSLIRLFACPKLESLVLRESNTWGVPSLTIMSYATEATPLEDIHISSPSGLSKSRPLRERFAHRLFLRSANLCLGCQAMEAVRVTTLELNRVLWPAHAKMKTMFASMKNLKNLFILDLYPNEELIRILGYRDISETFNPCVLSDLESFIEIPSLETLMIAFNQAVPTSQIMSADDGVAFVRIFSLPSLRSLHLKTFNLERWKSLVDTFTRHTSEYPALTSLTLTDMTDLIPTDPHYTNLAFAFPRLRQLSLDGVPSNALVRQLLHTPKKNQYDDLEASFIDVDTQATPALPLPDLEVLSICNDANVSKPLLHRAISMREDMGRPLAKLCLDKYFLSNLESWNWIKEHVEVVSVGSELSA
ncbi:hypothetical protein BDZ97DRAFT_2081302 [Flammula alnicola]|nr:hypothetical protein BDZ97DRAFT_2081302 [Flammula alnicola]